jgi:hypothetical protein
MQSYLDNHHQAFGPDEVLILVGAFDKAWQSVLDSGARLDGAAEPIREILAKRIVDAAKLGERDQDRLCKDALDHLANSLLDAPDNVGK